ncbi:MAG: PP2C family protein-serine/threonine phosphatase [Pirellulaceae bacterium]
MRILVGWDSAAESETIQSFLNIGDNTADVFGEATPFEAALMTGSYDVVLLALNFPTQQDCFPLFQRIRRERPDTPIVGAWFQGELSHIAKFILSGLHSYLLRDSSGEFIMLLITVLEAAHQSVLAHRARLLADKLREEVESVRQLQESVIPASLPQMDGYKIVARYEPSEIRVLGDRPVVMAGGDYYDAFRVRDNTLIMILGDAAGHGMRACMSIMTMHTLIGMIRDQSYPDTAEFVTEVNRRLCRSTVVSGDSGGFITLLYGSLNTDLHKLQWTSAGHPIPLIQDLATNEVRPLGLAEQCGLPLVVAEDWEYPSVEVDIPLGSRVLLYSDGLEEAFPNDNERHRQFGLAGITQTLKETAHLPLEQVLDELFAASNRATNGSGRMDDTSVMLLERSQVR